MKLKKFEQFDDDQLIDEYLVDKFSLEDESEFIGSYSMNNEIGFLFGMIDNNNVTTWRSN